MVYFLGGFENNNGNFFNFILSNGSRSTQRDDANYYTHMIPEDALKMIRSVTIHYNASFVTGFFFFDKNGLYLWSIGYTLRSNETVMLAENEVIVGVVAKLWGSGNPSTLTSNSRLQLFEVIIKHSKIGFV